MLVVNFFNAGGLKSQFGVLFCIEKIVTFQVGIALCLIGIYAVNLGGELGFCVCPVVAIGADAAGKFPEIARYGADY